MELIFKLDNLENAADFVISNLKENSIVLLDGEMGAGKTTLSKSICFKLGVEDNVSSPTFSIVNEYLDAKNQSIYHFDFYRINDLNEAYDIGAEEYFYSGNLCLIEWASKVESIIPNQYILVYLDVIDEETRKLTISYGG